MNAYLPRRLRWPLLTLLASLLLAAGWVAYAWHGWQKENMARTALSDTLRRQRADIQRLRDAQQVRLQYADRYRTLQAAGVVGPDRRLEWVERLRDWEQRYPDEAPTWTFEPRSPAPWPVVSLPAPLQMQVSRASISLPIWHEGRLVELMSALQASPGLFAVEGCRLTRQSATADVAAAPPLAAECRAQWFTIAPPDPEPQS